jgi:hypothetical protein
MQGSSVISIPSSSYRSCQNCDFYDRTMLKSGQNPVYKLTCKHPQSPTDLWDGLKNDKTPSWCPFLKCNNETRYYIGTEFKKLGNEEIDLMLVVKSNYMIRFDMESKSSNKMDLIPIPEHFEKVDLTTFLNRFTKSFL